ncbi:hypothetical protein [Actinokineospora bangkokensis]|uniref:Fibronectin type-III domain-containing protein n=1 Tax=Actinokineospora bangkokensis TaxID=1193682 RepID=A0A1Q9LHE3_9PSEU|nr:hypothetical protein [Actinokineospora bangkokensis]OLR91443.1 hypothetical protein BJP25_00990 [Actinokineospora bangkokensis]
MAPARTPNLRKRLLVLTTAAAGLTAAVLVLRTPESAAPPPAGLPAPQTSVAQFAAEGVVLPTPGQRPPTPTGIQATPGPNRATLRWSPAPNATGYEVTRDSTTFLVASPVVQLNALTSDAQVQVRAVDAFGQRSEPATTTVTPQAQQPRTGTFHDTFDQQVLPDPRNWRVVGSSDCGRATRGEGTDSQRLIVSGQCGRDTVVLRSRTPLRLNPNGSGAITVDTDHPARGGALTIDLVPGPADLVGSPTSERGEPGRALDDPALPPGTIRVRVSGNPSQTEVQVSTAPGMPRTGAAIPTSAPNTPEIGVTVRWQVTLAPDGLRVLRDGSVVAAADVVPAWREATPLIGFSGNPSVYAGVDAVLLDGAPTAPPALVPPPVVNAERTAGDVANGVPASTAGTGRAQGAGGQLRLTLVPQSADPDEYQVEVAGRRYPTRPAVAGQPHARGVAYPVVADLPAAALRLDQAGRLGVRVVGPVRPGVAATRVETAGVELVPDPAAAGEAVAAGREVPLPAARAALPKPVARFLDAAGERLPDEAPVPRGRLVLEITTDGRAGQAVAGTLAGVAGLEVRLDGELVAGIPTTADGPGTGGAWRVALPTSGLATGKHSVEVKLVGTAQGAAFAVANAPFTLSG